MTQNEHSAPKSKDLPALQLDCRTHRGCGQCLEQIRLSIMSLPSL